MEARQSSKFVPNEVSPRFRRALKSGSRSVRALVFHGVLLGSVLFAGVATPRLWGATPDNPSSFRVSKLDTYLLDDISRRSFRYFWEQTDPHTGLVMDRALVTGKPDDDPRHRNVASIAATGFGLTADCIAAQHRWISPEVARQRILTTLRFFAEKAPREHGWFFHFLDAKTGERRWDSEVSSIDTALLLAGILTTQQAFANDPEIVRLSTLIYDRVDFPWMLNGSRVFLSHGWKPETGFLPYRWDTYSEAKILYTLAIGSPTHPISPDAWHAWKLPIVDDAGYTFIGGGPLFTHQYSQAWLDLRNYVYARNPLLDRFVPHVNFFANAVAATRAQRATAIDLSQHFPGYSANVWGVTASDSPNGYVAWGDMPRDSRIDGTVVPSAAAGSLMFAPEICIPALRTMLVQYGKKIYGRYGFADAFNPSTGWVSRKVIGINVGITLLSAENLRTGDVWDWFMSDLDVQRALYFVGLVLNPSPTSPLQVLFSPPRIDVAGENASGAEIGVSDQRIPVSAFQYTIPVHPR